jgi:hypothetical protein
MAEGSCQGRCVTDAVMFHFSPPGSPAEAALRVDEAPGVRLHAVEIDAFSAAAPMTYLHCGTPVHRRGDRSGPTSELVALSVPTPAAN